jgi:hypothetical protein
MVLVDDVSRIEVDATFDFVTLGFFPAELKISWWKFTHHKQETQQLIPLSSNLALARFFVLRAFTKVSASHLYSFNMSQPQVVVVSKNIIPFALEPR